MWKHFRSKKVAASVDRGGVVDRRTVASSLRTSAVLAAVSVYVWSMVPTRRTVSSKSVRSFTDSRPNAGARCDFSLDGRLMQQWDRDEIMRS